MSREFGPRVLLVPLFAFLLAGLWAGFVAWRSPDGLREELGPLAILLGAGLGTATFVVGYFVIRESRGLRSLAQARRGEGPADGEMTCVVGTLEARSDEALTAPFSARRALAYKYAVTRSTPAKTGNRNTATLVTAFYGEAMAPCEIRTGDGAVALLERPSLVGDGDCVEGDEAYGKAREHLATTPFTCEGDPDSLSALSREPGEDADRQFQATGAFQTHAQPDLGRSRGVIEGPFDLSRWSLHELVFAPGTMVCATGIWSAERGGLLPPEGGTEGLLLELGDSGSAGSRRKSNLGCLGLVGFVLILFQVLLGLGVWILGV